MKKNELPLGYGSWLQLLIDQKHIFEEDRKNMSAYDIMELSRSKPDYQIDKDYMLSMAMKELLPVLIDPQDLELLFHASKIGFSQMVIDEDRKNRIIENLFQNLRLLHK